MLYRIFAIATLMLTGAVISLYETPIRPAPPEMIAAARETVIQKTPKVENPGLVSTPPQRRDYTKGQWI
jgi:hypothetical protein